MGTCDYCGVRPDKIDVIDDDSETGMSCVCFECHPDQQFIKENYMQLEAEDMVNKPPHYNQGSVECIEAIRAALTKEEFEGYCKGNAMKYIWRHRHKGEPKENLDKAAWYLDKLTNG